MACTVTCVRCKTILFARVPELTVTEVAALYDHVRRCADFRNNDPPRQGELGGRILQFFEIGWTP